LLRNLLGHVSRTTIAGLKELKKPDLIDKAVFEKKVVDEKID
jgi:hypothetical protein